ncbi:rhodanese-like domain-containing protein [Candidatus Venteria ishoeyi]|uniref:rhodanese-like domain-containing protein n=1 Tax=Candidatus Venteria ishoeyi TaxID=1899563 RepID=UPI0025A5F772|nr:rhodanese-like domain-containing protein [Candidatus Venteria ishoeyi]MDM8546144.1 rhodanese-like domain-containing protein [Candidatus Venteria ishoeyi]
MKTFDDMIAECLEQGVQELMPWDLSEWLEEATRKSPILLDIREPYEYQQFHLENSINVPRGILESACEYGYEETVPEMACSRERDIVLICRSGKRSVLAAYTLHQMGFHNTISLKTGVKGWNDFDQPMINNEGAEVDLDEVDAILTEKPTPAQLGVKI